MKAAEAIPQTISEHARFSGGQSKLFRDIEANLISATQHHARMIDLISLYENTLIQISTAKGFDNVGKWAKNQAKQALNRAEKL